jgi:hypothetical protein
MFDIAGCLERKRATKGVFETMRQIGLLLAAFAAFLTFSDFAEARDGCGPGWRWNGYRCVPYRAPPPPPAYGPGYYGGPVYGAPGYRPRRTYNGCQPGWTVQSGVCKPYRGY